MKTKATTARQSGRYDSSRYDELTDAELLALETFRRDRRLSYRELADAITLFIGVRMPERTITKVLKVPGPLFPTTSEPIRKYIRQYVLAANKKAS